MAKHSGKLWGGRFSQATHAQVERFTHSFPVDQRLARWDLTASLAHAQMLGRTRTIPAPASKRIEKGLTEMLSLLEQHRLRLDRRSEDIHTAIQRALRKKIGAVADRLQTARSRNDQVVTAFRLWTKETLAHLDQAVLELQRAVLSEARKTQKLLLPGYTHLRHAQPVTVAHWLTGYLPALQRDRERLRGAFNRADELPLGSGALAGTSLKIDRGWVARKLKFSRVSLHSMDAVSSRDFVIEALSALAMLSLHLARIAEDFLLFSTDEFGFIAFKEPMLTGSSMMPQKQNPDFLELVRAGSARVAGNLSAAVTLVKGLPTGYQRDLQLDKELLFEAADRVKGMLGVLTPGFKAIRWNLAALNAQLADEALYATDLAEYLVAKGIPFADAHQAVGQLLAYANRRGTALRSLPLAAFQRFSRAFDADVRRLLDPSVSVERKRSLGSTNPRLVRQAIRRWKARLGSLPRSARDSSGLGRFISGRKA